MDREWKLLPPTGSKRAFIVSEVKKGRVRDNGPVGAGGGRWGRVSGGWVGGFEQGGGVRGRLRGAARTFCSAPRATFIHFKALPGNLFHPRGIHPTSHN